MTIEAEAAVISAALVDFTVASVTPLAKEHFSNPVYAAAWEMLTVYSDKRERLTPLLLNHELQQKGFKPLNLPENPMAVSQVAQATEVIVNTWLSRNIEFYSRKFASLPARERVLALHGKLDELLCAVPTTGRTAAEIVATYTEAIANKPADFRVGIHSGIGLESFSPGGIPADKLTVIFAQTGMLKSTTGLNLAVNAAKAGNRVVVFSLEDSEELTMQSLVSISTGIPLQRLYTQNLLPDEHQKLKYLPKYLQNIIIESDIPRDMRQVTARVKRHHAQARVDIVIVDYAQLFDSSGSEREALGEIAKTARLAAHTDKIAYVLLSQVNEAKMRERKSYIPALDDIFGSSVIKQCAKLAFGIYRPCIHEPERSEDSEYIDLPHAAYESLVEIHVRKNKLGPLGRLLLSVDLPTGRLTANAADTTPSVGF